MTYAAPLVETDGVDEGMTWNARTDNTNASIPAMRYLNENCKTCERRQEVTPGAISVAALHAPAHSRVARVRDL